MLCIYCMTKKYPEEIFPLRKDSKKIPRPKQ